jgi:hypothetical protein
MQSITTVSDLKKAIEQLETEKVERELLMKEQFSLVADSFKPVNLAASVIKDIVSTPFLVDNLMGTSIGLVSGFLSRKLLVGSSSNAFKKIAGSFLQFGVTNIVASHSGALKNIGNFIFPLVKRKKAKGNNVVD